MTKQARTLSSLLEAPRWAWLDAVAGPVQGAAHAVYRASPVGMKVKSLLNGTPLRHRMHPMLIAVPLGAWTMAVVLDAIEGQAGRRERQGLRAAADTSVAVGVIGALPTAMSGVADWVDLYDHHRRVGMAHALLNTVALGCYGVSLALRTSGGSRGLAKALSNTGYGVLALGGALGGELVYTLGVNVPHTIYPKPPDEETDVLASDELVEGTPVVVEVGRVPVLLLRHNGAVHAVQDWCPHAGGPLSQGTFDGDIVECPWHQSRFCLADGAPVQGPASVPLRTFEVREAGGRILVTPSYEAQSWPPPPEPIRDRPQHIALAPDGESQAST
ncbi:MAG TPA: Rieske 2Fe-2S domain-containing protein [Thermomicrobiales bacterium]|nr:Rieske 2Fe-2S domain-containing protein [Thermomicrobiales bacterium]